MGYFDAIKILDPGEPLRSQSLAIVVTAIDAVMSLSYDTSVQLICI